MKLEDQVISLDIAKRIKALGVRQESLFYHQESYDLVCGQCKPNGRFHILFIGDQQHLYHTGICESYSAFTIAELGEMLPHDGFKHGKLKKACCYKENGKWYTTIFDNKASTTLYKEDGASEANARGKTLIYLLENNLIDLEASHDKRR